MWFRLGAKIAHNRVQSARMRLLIFTDTLGDVNGVSRFIQNVARQGLETGRSVEVVTSTNLPLPSEPNLHNVPPRWSRPMPRYEHLEVVLPRGGAIRARAAGLSPDVVHLSTPGPVGWVGWRWARWRGLPIVGVYHTDFPAYVERLWGSRWLGRVCARVMRGFYGPMTRVVTRSGAYRASVAGLGVDPGRIVALRPGIDTSRFTPGHRDPGIWARVGAPELGRPGVNVASITRVSVEKNLPLLAAAWGRVRELARGSGVAVRLVVVGDGPYRAAMEARLAPQAGSERDVFFVGFRHGAELSALYATSDLFVFPSATDTLGQVVMEAQSSGLAALVSDRGGPGEVIEPGVTGLVLPSDDAEAWARAIVGLAGDEARRRAMGAAAAQRMASMTIRASFEHYWQIHEEALASWVGQRGGRGG